MFETVLQQLAVVAVFVQRVIDFVKPLYTAQKWKHYMTLGLSVLVSALLCVSWGVDLFKAVELTFSLSWVGAAFTGVFAGLGANVLNDVLKLLEIWKSKQLPK